MNPIFKSLGGKRRLAPSILAAIGVPDPDVFCEPFAGGAAVLAALKPAGKIVLGDADVGVAAVFKLCQNKTWAGMASVRLRGLACAYDIAAEEWRSGHYYAARDRWNGWISTGFVIDDPDKLYEIATTFLDLRALAFNGLFRYSKAGNLNSAWGHYERYPVAGAASLVEWAAFLADRTTVIHGAWGSSLAAYVAAGASPKSVCYMDPPYVGTFDQYAQDQGVGSLEGLRPVLAAGLKLPGVVAMSNSPDALPLIQEMWPGCEVIELAERNRVNRDGDGRKLRGEVLAIRRP